MKLTNKTINFSIDTVAQLLLTTGTENDTVIVTDENQGGVFIFRPENASINNGGTIFNGWTRQYDGAVSVEWFGAKGDGVTDDTVAIQSAMNNHNAVIVPEGTFAVSNTILIPSNTSLSGINNNEAKIISSSSVVLATNGNSNIKVENLYLQSTGTTYGSTVWISNGGNNILLKECDIVSAYRPIGINDSNGAYSTTNVNIIRNKIYTNHPTDGGIRVRTSADGVKNIFATFIENNITIDGSISSDVGIEAWAGNTVCENNKIKAPQMNGSYSGITFGTGENQVARGNYIFGFGLGIEIGGSANGLHIIDGNIIEACLNGCAVTTSGIEEAVLFTNNIVEFDDKYGLAYDTAFTTKCVSTSFIGNTCIHKDTSTSPSWTSYLDASSREYRAFYADTNHRSLIISNNTIKNFSTGVRASATGQSVSISNNIFDNLFYPVLDSGSSPRNIFIGNQVHNFQTLRINGYLQASNNSFSRNSDFPIYSGATITSCPFVMSYNTNNVIIYNTNNVFTQCSNSAITYDSSYAEHGSGYGRCDLEVRENHFVTQNSTDPSYILGVFAACNISPRGETVRTWYNEDVFIFLESSTITYGDMPTAGTWRRGDRVYTSYPSSGGTEGWICVTSGTPGTWKTFGAITA
jgi:hypothetical protein